MAPGPQFSMPQPEPQPEPDVRQVVRDNTAFTSRILRREMRELQMRISELSNKVDTLISVATNIKSTADGQAAAAAAIPEDDPEIAALGQRIDDAIAVLQGTPRAAPAGDPNAPV